MGKKKAKVAPNNVAPTDASVPDALTGDNNDTETQTDEALEAAQKEAEEAKTEAAKEAKEAEEAKAKVAELEAKVKAMENAKAVEPDTEEDEPVPDEPEETVTIIIPSSAEFDGKEDVFLNANGRRFQIKRDEEVEVPMVVVNTLRDAVKTEYDRDKSGRIIGSRNVSRFPFQTL
ncbi:hypothetical protein SYK_06650 [Pseudodesulfovibrio nedwellii]|uniref:Uncharacterized protein n=1 Tax=Pseudodesulfovibrio nedwellii TaxID=2973072 RepID=A0ABN6S1S6_9BACT|nr:hypothetical protein [Pseudodesulfovibrio nedwellii]BDQ36305.1 hypothetical protein SYK_06650 [Pseudodesulfovibrio nedwellii]